MVSIIPIQLIIILFSIVATSAVVCPPGFIKQSPDNDTIPMCKCIDGSYRNIISCNDINGNITAYIMRGGWIGNYSGQIVAGFTPYFFLPSDTPDIMLPADWSEVDEVLCSPLHRKGVLCGTCENGFGSSLEISLFQCVKCTQIESRVNWIWYLFLEYFPLTLLFLVLLLFDLHVTSGGGSAFIFFAQMITTTFDIRSDGVLPLNTLTHNHTDVIITLYRLPYGIWNLEFFSILASPYCLSPKLGTYGMMFINYGIAIYPLFLIIIFSFMVWLYERGLTPIVIICRPLHKCLVWLKQKWKFHQSIIGVFATFITLSYSKFILTSIFLITSNELYDERGDVSITNIPYYNGNTEFSDTKLIVMYIIAVVILLIYVVFLPILLVSPSLLQALHRVTGWNWLVRYLPWGRTQEFLQGFHGCYKDGSTNKDCDYRWYSGFFLVLRAVFFLIYAFTPNLMIQYTIQGTICISIMFLLTATKPFRKEIHNILHIGVFCILGVSNGISILHVYRMVIRYRISLPLFVIQYIMIFIPLIFVVLVITYHIWKCNRLSLCRHGNQSISKSKNSSTLQEILEQEEEEKRQSDFKDDVTDFLRFTEKSGRLKRSSRESTWFVSTPTDSHDGSSSYETSGHGYKYGSILVNN